MAEQEQKKEEKVEVKDDGSNVYVAVRMEVTSQDNLDKFLTILRPAVAKTNKEKGCLQYNIHQDKKNPLLFQMVEKWENQTLLDAHLKSAHITPLFTKAFAKIVKLEPSFCKKPYYESPKESPIGSKVPSQDVFIFTKDDGPKKVSTSEIFADKKVVVFGIPGCYTPTCQSKHAPTYVEKFDEFKKIGIDAVYCLSVNDPFVCNAFNKTIGGEGKLQVISDFDASFCTALKATISIEQIGLGVRADRFSFYAVNGVIEQFFKEPDAGKVTNSDAGTIINAINLCNSLKD